MFKVGIGFCCDVMKNSTFIFSALVILAIQAMAFGQSAKVEVAKIESYCKGIDSMTKKAKQPDLIFADTAAYEDQSTKPKWQKFPSEKALEKFLDESVSYSSAYNWRKEGKIVASNFTNSGESGDWN